MDPLTRRLSLLAAAAAVIALPAQGLAQQAVRIGSATSGSVFYTIGVAISEMARKHAGLNSTVEPLGGSAANMFAIGAKKVEFALANAYAARTAFEGAAPFKEPMPVRLVMQGQPSYRGMVVAKSADIKSFGDLAGDNIAANRPPLPELLVVFKAMAKTYGVPLDKFNVVRTTTFQEQDAALRTGTAKAAVLAFGARASTVGQLFQSGTVVPFYMSEQDRDRMLKVLPPSMHAGDLKPGIWPEQTQTWHLVAMNAYFMTRTDAPAETVYKVVKAVLDHPEEFRAYHAAARFWTVENALRNAAVPFHEGAIRYFKEKGVWTAESEARQKALLK